MAYLQSGEIYYALPYMRIIEEARVKYVEKDYT
jgi:hypothetical protein